MQSSSIGASQAGLSQSNFSLSTGPAFKSEASNPAAGKIASLLQDTLFEKNGDGANIRNQDSPLLGMVADYMDKKPDTFGKPHDATGNVGGWKDEVKEDGYLNNQETESFTKGLEGFINEMLGEGADSKQGVGNNSGGGQSSGATTSGSSAELKDMLSSLLGSLGEEKLDNMLKTPSDPKRQMDGEKEFSLEDKDQLKEVSRFMDMHPEEFGKPDGASKDWMGELSEGDQFMSRPESEQFQKAIDMMKSEVKDSAHGNSMSGLFPDAEQNFQNGGAGNTLKTDASVAAGNLLSVLTQQNTSR